MRLSSSVLLTTSLLFSISTCFAQNNLSDLKHVAELAKTIHYVDANQDKVWPNFHLTQYPIILNFIQENSYPTYAFQFTPKNSKWQRLEVENTVVYFQNNADFDTRYSIDFMNVEDQWSLIQKIPPFEREFKNEINALVLYLFNDYQIKSKFSRAAIDYAAYTYDGYNNITNIALAMIERASLKDYLSNNNLEALKNYLALHSTRMTALNSDSVKFEKALELSKGTQHYVAVKSTYITDQDYINESLSYYPGSYCSSLNDKYNIAQCLSYSQYNFVDLALGYALDKLAISDWKKTIEATNITFSDLLSKQYPMSEAEVAQRVNDAKLNYQYDQLVAKLESTLKDYLEDMHQQQNAYEKLPGNQVSVDVTGCSSLLPNHIQKYYKLNSKTVLRTQYKARYLCDGNNYRMNVLFDYTPFVFATEQHNPDHSTTDVASFKVPSDTLLIVDGKQETVGSFIEAGKKLSFHQLLINNNQVLVRINELTGVLDGSHNSLTITLPKDRLKNKVKKSILK